MLFEERFESLPSYYTQLQKLLIILQEEGIYSYNEIQKLAEFFGVEIPKLNEIVEIHGKTLYAPAIIIVPPSRFSEYTNGKIKAYDGKYYPFTVVSLYNFMNDLARGRVPFRQFTVFAPMSEYMKRNAISLLKNVEDTAVCYQIHIEITAKQIYYRSAIEFPEWKKKFILTQLEMCNDPRLEQLLEQYIQYDESLYWKYPTIEKSTSEKIDNKKIFEVATKYGIPIATVRMIYTHRTSKSLQQIAKTYGIDERTLNQILQELS